MAEQRKKMGRPSKFSKEVAEQIVELVRQGNYIETAALYCGLKPGTVRQWMKEGAKFQTGVKRDFLLALRKAAAEPEVEDMSVIKAAAYSDWRAAAWRLEHRYPQRYARKTTKHQVTGAKGGPVVVETKSADEMSDDELAAIAARGVQ